MKILTKMAAAAVLLLALAPGRAPAQEDEGDGKKTVPGLPSRYIDCLQDRTIDALLGSPVTQWGLSEELGKTAYDRFYGIQLCRGYQRDTVDYCRELARVPGRSDRTKVTKELGRDCASDVEFFRTHAALRAEDPASVSSHCRRWCDLEAGKAAGKFDCDNFCRQVIPLMPDKGAQACKHWTEQLARENAASPEDIKDALPECLMMLAPSPANCTDRFGPATQRSCRERSEVLEALRLKDPKRCPKGLRYGPVCAAVLAPEDKARAAACQRAVRSFTKPFCDERRQTGGLQDETKLPGDADVDKTW